MRSLWWAGELPERRCAIALRRLGAEVTVYEAYSDPAGPYGSFVSLAGNGLRALAALGCLPQVQQAGFAVDRQRMWSGSGKLLGDVPRGRRESDSRMSVTIMRRDLVSVLRQEAIRLGARVVLGERVLGERVPDGDDARLADADLIVGADGIWSAIRRAVDPAAPEPGLRRHVHRLRNFRGLGRGGRLVQHDLRPSGAFIYLPAPDGTVWWSAQVAGPVPHSTWPPIGGRRPRDGCWRLRRERGHDPRRQPARIPSHLEPRARPACRPASTTRRMVLVGDAAHPVGAGSGRVDGP